MYSGGRIMSNNILYLKGKLFIIIIFLLCQNLFSQEVFQMEIKAKYYKLIEKTYHDMEIRGINLSEYEISIKIENNILHVRYFRPSMPPMLGSPPESPTINYEIDVTSGEIIKIRGER